MKKLRSKEDVVRALELYQLNERIKKDTKRADQLKAHFKDKLDVGAIECGEMLITMDLQSRESIDKKLLRSELGDQAEDFITRKEFKILKIRRAA